MERAAINPIMELLDDRHFNGYVKINHGFWDLLFKANQQHGWPRNECDLELLDKEISKDYFFNSNYVEELLDGVNEARNKIPGLEIVASLGDLPNRLTSQVGEKELFLSTITSIPFDLDRSMIFKAAVEDGSMLSFIKRIESKQLIVVAPSEHCSNSFLSASPLVEFIEIPYSTAIRSRKKILARIKSSLMLVPDSWVIIQAGSLSAWITTRLCLDFPDARFLDLGIAANSFSPMLLASRNQGWYAARKSNLNQYFTLFNDYMGITRSSETDMLDVFSYISQANQNVRARGATMSIHDVDVLVKQILHTRDSNERSANAFSPLLTDIGKLLQKKGAMEASLNCLTLAKEHTLPGFWQLLHQMYKVEIELENFDSALNHLEEARQIGKFEWLLSVEASMHCLKLNNRQGAMKFLETSLDLVDAPNKVQLKLLKKLS
jgi:tetratricopeptide (TPR) repeat protein